MLSQPDSISKAHSDSLLNKIIEIIKQQGPITFADYMRLALYMPGYGYYSAGAHKLGAQGDFVTAPEISPLFSYCLANQIAQIFKNITRPMILELGAGTGRMAVDILKKLAELNSLPNKYFILEVSADLKERQQKYFKKTAPEFLAIVQWLDHLPETTFNGVILANEVIDAMPVHKFKIQQGIKEFYVACDNNKIRWELATPQTKELTTAIENLQIDFDENYESEINLLLPSWLASLADCLKHGVILLIDYGFPRHEYYHPSRNMGTLMCHFRHQAHADPLIFPGIQDITAHVDFTAIAEAASAQDLKILGFTNQTAFLLNCGLLDLIAGLENQSNYYQLSQQIRYLTLPSEMGELFKVIALGKEYDESLLGFSQFNQMARL